MRRRWHKGKIAREGDSALYVLGKKPPGSVRGQEKGGAGTGKALSGDKKPEEKENCLHNSFRITIPPKRKKKTHQKIKGKRKGKKPCSETRGISKRRGTGAVQKRE